MLPFIVAIILIPVLGTKKSNAQGAETRRLFADLNAQVVDGVQGLKDIISFQWQLPFFSRFSRADAAYHASQMQYAMRSANEMSLFHLLMSLGGLCGQVVALILVARGSLSLPNLIPVFMLCAAVFSPLQDTLTMTTNYGMIFSAAKRLFDLFQNRNVVEDDGEKFAKDVLRIEKEGTSPVRISLKDVHFSYPRQHTSEPNVQVLHGLSFDFSTGETVALAGASGSGKTTVARLLQRFWDVDSGCITINGVDIRDIRLEELRDIVTLVPQEVYLFNMSIKDNLLLADPDADITHLYAASEDAQADGFIKRQPDGYETQVGERGLKLSGGEKQRCGTN